MGGYTNQTGLQGAFPAETVDGLMVRIIDKKHVEDGSLVLIAGDGTEYVPVADGKIERRDGKSDPQKSAQPNEAVKLAQDAVAAQAEADAAKVDAQKEQAKLDRQQHIENTGNTESEEGKLEDATSGVAAPAEPASKSKKN
jgi:hypothetical protein